VRLVGSPFDEPTRIAVISEDAGDEGLTLARPLAAVAVLGIDVNGEEPAVSVDQVGIVAPPCWRLSFRHQVSARVVDLTSRESRQGRFGDPFNKLS